MEVIAFTRNLKDPKYHPFHRNKGHLLGRCPFGKIFDEKHKTEDILLKRGAVNIAAFHFQIKNVTGESSAIMVYCETKIEGDVRKAVEAEPDLNWMDQQV